MKFPKMNGKQVCFILSKHNLKMQKKTTRAKTSISFCIESRVLPFFLSFFFLPFCVNVNSGPTVVTMNEQASLSKH
jgi:hypothetical protein